jgi:hypothetical protein
MNPRATETQLIRASKIYWVYGDEGQRFSYARQTERELNSRNARRRQGSPAAGNGRQRAIQVGQELLRRGLKVWQNDSFDYDKGFLPKGGGANSGHSKNSYHNHNQALDIPSGNNSPEKMRQTFAYLKANQQRLGIVELFWDGGGFYKNGQSIGGAGSNAIPNHDRHIHIAFS